MSSASDKLDAVQGKRRRLSLRPIPARLKQSGGEDCKKKIKQPREGTPHEDAWVAPSDDADWLMRVATSEA